MDPTQLMARMEVIKLVISICDDICKLLDGVLHPQ
jgi:hypothetical protein